MKTIVYNLGWKLCLIGLGAVGCGLLAVQSVRTATAIQVSEEKPASAPTETRGRQDRNIVSLEGKTLLVAESSREARQAAVISFLKEIDARRGYKDVGVMMDFVAWARNASKDDLITAMTCGHLVFSEKEYGGLLDILAFARLGELDPEAGQAMFYSLPGGRRPEADAFKAFFSSWARHDPVAAIDGALAQLHHDPSHMNDAIKKMFEPMLLENPALAEDFATELALSDEAAERELGRTLRVKMMNAQLNATKDFQATVRWIENTKASNDERQRLLSALVDEGLNREDVAGAVYVYHLLGAEGHSDLAGRVAIALAPTQPDQAKGLVLTLPSGDVRAKALGELVEKLSEDGGAVRALDWLSAQSPDPDFDETYETLAKRLLEDRPGDAFRSVAAMTDSDRKEKLTTAYGFLWLQRDYSNAAPKLAPDFVAQFERITELAAQIRGVDVNYHGTLQF